METITLAQPQQEVPECYICMEAATPENPFLSRPMCACSSKADSSLKVHQLCLELARDSTGKCAVCKTPLSGEWAFDGTFRRYIPYGGGKATFTQMNGDVRHGSEYALRRLHNTYGPIRYLAAKGQYKAGKLDGPQFEYQPDGSAAWETNYLEGILHGKRLQRNAKGTVELEETFENGKLHGPRIELCRGIQLTGQFEKGVKVGEHLEADKVTDSYGVVFTRYISRATYKAGVLDGPYVQFHIDAGEGLPSETAVYRDGKLNGLQEQWYVDTTKLERMQTLEAHWLDGQRNGRYATFVAGKPDQETWYYMDKKHGLERKFYEGKLMKELTWHMDVKHGRIREWTSGGRVLMDAAYDNGLRHGRFVTQYLRGFNSVTVTEDFWSDGTKELRHGMKRVKEGSLVTQEVHYKMGVRHGLSLKHDSYGDGYIFKYRDGKLHGKCTVMLNDQVQAQGSFSNGVPVGKHMLFCDGALKESVSYDSEGRLHGKCVFNQSDGTPFQAFNYEHGQLHGRQVIYFAGTKQEKRVFNMRKGYVHGRFTMYDERGAELENMLLKQDEGIALQECLGKDALCMPSVRLADGTYANRWTRADGTLFDCANAAAGNECECEDCYVPPARKPMSDYCGCALCCGAYDDDDDEEYRNDDFDRDDWRESRRWNRRDY